MTIPACFSRRTFRTPLTRGLWACLVVAGAQLGCSDDGGELGTSLGGGTGTTGGSASGGTATGGAPGLGGSWTTGGVVGSGGSTATGGVVATGGFSSTGGFVGIGGQSTTGGTATGGTLAMGGAAPGGQSATGGSGTGGFSEATGGSLFGAGGQALGGGTWVGQGGSTLGGSGGDPTGGIGGSATGGTGMGGAGGAAAGGVGGDATAGAGGEPPTGFRPCPDTGPCKVLPLGDSITFGLGFEGGYRVELFHLALADNHEITFTGTQSPNGPTQVDGVPFPRNHEGISGETIEQIANRIPSPGLNDMPHIILLHAGTNDMWAGASGADTRLGALLDELIADAPDALIVVSNIIPFPGGGASVATFNAAVPGVFAARESSGAHILFVDQFEGFPESELGDRVHPNQAGYARMAAKWYEAIESYLP